MSCQTPSEAEYTRTYEKVKCKIEFMIEFYKTEVSNKL